MLAPKTNRAETRCLAIAYLVTGWLIAGLLFGCGEFTGFFQNFPEGITGILLLLVAPVFIPLVIMLLGVFACIFFCMDGEYGRAVLAFLVAISVGLFISVVHCVLYGRQQRLVRQTP